MKKFLVFVLIIAAISAAAIFLLPTSEEHNFATEWTFDDENHWHACLDDGCTVKSNEDSHRFDEGEETTPATEDAEGVMTYTCKTCGFEKTESIAKLEHKHSYEKDWSSDDVYHWHASTCGHEPKDKAAHIFDEGYIEVYPTDTTEGLIIYTCTQCRYSYEETLGVTGHTHTFADEWTTDATYHWHAATCGHSLSKDKDAHEFGKGEITKQPTEEEEGITSYFCKTCGYEKQESINKLPHTHKYATDWTSDADYHWHASTCGHNDTIVKNYHSFDEGKVTTQPTDTVDGVKTYTCADCGYAKTEAIPALSHTHTYETTYSKDASYHWYAPTCAHANAAVKVAHSYDANGNCVCGFHGICEFCGGCLTASCSEHSNKCLFADKNSIITYAPQADYLNTPEGPNGIAPGNAGAYNYDTTIQAKHVILNDGAYATLVTLPHGTTAHSGVSFWDNQSYESSGREGFNCTIPLFANKERIVRMHFVNMGASEISFKFSCVHYYKDLGVVEVTLAPGESKTVLMTVKHSANSVGPNHQIVFTKDAAVNASVAIWGEYVSDVMDKNLYVDTPANKTTFYVGEQFSAAGLVLKGESSASATASIGNILSRVYISKNYITSFAEGYTFTSADAGVKTVNVTFAGKTVSYTVTVIDHAADSCAKCGKCSNQICEFPGCQGKCEGHFDADKMTVMSFNLGTNGVNNEYNKPNLLNKLMKELPDILGTQEENSSWTDALNDTLARYGYKNVIMYREGMRTSNLGNEGTGIWYNSLRFDLVEWGYFWMSETPNTSSIWSQYGAQYKRVTTWAKLTDKASGKTFVYYNTHIGYESSELWVCSADMIMERMHAHYNEGYPVIITGDFNFALNSDGAPDAYAVFMNGLSDSHYSATVKDYEAGKQNSFSEYGKYQGSGSESTSDVGNRKHVLPIDYIMYSAGFKAEYYTILREELPEGVTEPDRQYFSSDHFALKTVFSFTDDFGKHICWEPCDECGKCKDVDCKLCETKCPGHHTCDILCEGCGLCANLDGECRAEQHCPAYKITLNGATFENGTNVTYGCKLTTTIVLDSTKTFEGIIDSAKNYYDLETIKSVELTGNTTFKVLYQEDMLAYAASDTASSKVNGITGAHVLKDGIYMTTVTFAKDTAAGKYFAGRGIKDSGSMPLNWCAPANGKNIGIIYIYNHADFDVKIQYMVENYGAQNEELKVTLKPGLNRIVLIFGLGATHNDFYACDHQIILLEDAKEEIVLDTYGYILADGLVDNINLVSAPTKLTYKVGETFTTEGMSITASVNTRESYITNATVDYEGRVFTADDIGTHTVTVKYRDFYATFEIQVTE